MQRQVDADIHGRADQPNNTAEIHPDEELAGRRGRNQDRSKLPKLCSSPLRPWRGLVSERCSAIHRWASVLELNLPK
jgi:hypothetical protein